MGLNKFGRIAVLMGGASSEREISLKSGKAVYENLTQAELDTVAIDIQTEDIQENSRLFKAHNIDCAFIALHGRFGEDGQIQAILDNLKIPYTGSGVEASQLAMDKIASRDIFKAGGLDVPSCKIMSKDSGGINLGINNMPLPLVVKPATQGSSIGLSIVDSKEYLNKALDLAFSFDKRIIVEEYITGREVTVGILDDQPLPVIEIIPKKRFFDYEAKYIAGMTEYRVLADLDESVAQAIKNAGLLAHKLLGCQGCSRVDVILGENNKPFVLEVNTIPGLTQTSLLPKAAGVAGIDFLSLCLKLLELAYAKNKR